MINSSIPLQTPNTILAELSSNRLETVKSEIMQTLQIAIT